MQQQQEEILIYFRSTADDFHHFETSYSYTTEALNIGTAYANRREEDGSTSSIIYTFEFNPETFHIRFFAGSEELASDNSIRDFLLSYTQTEEKTEMFKWFFDYMLSNFKVHSASEQVMPYDYQFQVPPVIVDFLMSGDPSLLSNVDTSFRLTPPTVKYEEYESSLTEIRKLRTQVLMMQRENVKLKIRFRRLAAKRRRRVTRKH